MRAANADRGRWHDIALLAVALAAILGIASFVLLGWTALVLTGYGAHAGEGVVSSRPVVLALIFAPVLLPLAGWWALKRGRYGWALAFAALALVPAALWIEFWMRIS